MGQFWVSATQLKNALSLADIKQQDRETFKDYHERFNDMEEEGRGFDKSQILMAIVTGVDKQTELDHELTKVKPASLIEFLYIAEQYPRLEAFNIELSRLL